MKSVLWIIAVLIVFAFTSCEKWFEVTPAGEVAEDDLFRNGEGFQELSERNISGYEQGFTLRPGVVLGFHRCVGTVL